MYLQIMISSRCYTALNTTLGFIFRNSRLKYKYDGNLIVPCMKTKQGEIFMFRT